MNTTLVLKFDSRVTESENRMYIHVQMPLCRIPFIYLDICLGCFMLIFRLYVIFFSDVYIRMNVG